MEDRTMMRAALPLLAALGALAACANQPREVASTPPAVSYRVNGADVAQANASATNYCRHYGLAPQLQSIQPASGGNIASYTCGTTASSSAPVYSGSSTAPYPGYGGAPVQCADLLHQDRPGGSDYYGPPVPGCTRP